MVKSNKNNILSKSDIPIWSLGEDELISRISTDTVHGLTATEAAARLELVGPNAISQGEQTPAWVIFLRQFKSPIVLLLFVAAGLSFAFQEWLDGIAILVVIFINAIIGFYMEFQAGRSMEALKKMVSISVKVLRDGSLSEINSEILVPGDVIYLEAGDMTPADARLFNSAQMQVDEASLTGESVPVEKAPAILPTDTPLAEQSNLLFKGTFITKGNGWAVVTGTGMNTELGKIAHLVGTSDQAVTPLERKLEAFSGRLIKITVGLVVVIFGIGVIGGKPIVEMLETAIALGVAAVPEGLPIVATLALAQGMLRLAHHNVIVRNFRRWRPWEEPRLFVQTKPERSRKTKWRSKRWFPLVAHGKSVMMKNLFQQTACQKRSMAASCKSASCATTLTFLPKKEIFSKSATHSKPDSSNLHFVRVRILIAFAFNAQSCRKYPFLPKLKSWRLSIRHRKAIWFLLKVLPKIYWNVAPF